MTDGPKASSGETRKEAPQEKIARLTGEGYTCRALHRKDSCSLDAESSFDELVTEAGKNGEVVDVGDFLYLYVKEG